MMWTLVLVIVTLLGPAEGGGTFTSVVPLLTDYASKEICEGEKKRLTEEFAITYAGDRTATSTFYCVPTK